jgi:hypothetical protein
MPAVTEEGSSSRDAQLARTIELLDQGLHLVDDLKDYPDLGARLADIIEALKGEQGDPH